MKNLKSLIRHLFTPYKDVQIPKPHYVFCERETATSVSPWHIRKLTEQGRKLGGGADTLALCGAKVAWDLDLDLDKSHFSHTCSECVKKYRKNV